MKKIDDKTLLALQKHSDDKLKKLSVVFMVFAVVLAIPSFFIMPYGIIFLLIALFFFFNGKNFRDVVKYRNDPNYIPPADPAKKPDPVPDGQMNYDLFDDVTPHGVLKYQYENNIFFLHKENFQRVVGMGGKQIGFIFEEDNPVDPKAVKICTMTGDEIGYVNKGQTQDMLHDWERKGWEFAGYINKYSVEDQTATYKIGFYRPLDTFDSKDFRLTKISKKVTDDDYYSRFSALGRCKEGDIVRIEYSDYDDTFIVLEQESFSTHEIGELPASVEKFIDGRPYDKLIGVIHDIEADDPEEPASATVTVYII